MHATYVRGRRRWFAGIAFGLLIVVYAAPSHTRSQPPADLPRPSNREPDREHGPLRTSYDQVSPVLLGQESFRAMMNQDRAERPTVMERQKALLEHRYDLRRHVDEKVRMSRGKPIAVGPATRLPEGLAWEDLARMSPEEIRDEDLFPLGSYHCRTLTTRLAAWCSLRKESSCCRDSNGSTSTSICLPISCRSSRRRST